jgi:hypothetical protein
MDYEHGECVDSGTAAEWWAPDVGLVKWTEESFAGPRTYVLVEFSGGETAPTFRRGDPDGSGTIDLSDAIGVLSWLFLGGPAPGCQDAADADDDGAIDLSDPIAILGFLFLGAGAPPAPGPDACGEDPTVDGLPTCEAGCGPAGIGGE